MNVDSQNPRQAHGGSSIDELIEALRRQIRGAVLRRLAWQALAAVALVGWLAVLIDRTFEPGATARLVAEVALVSAALVWLAAVAAPRLLRRVTDRQVVTLLHRHHPKVAALLGTSLELRKSDWPQAPDLVAATLSQADSAATSVRDTRLVRPASAMGVAWFAVVATTAAMFMGAVRPDLAGCFARRIALSEEAWPRRVQLSVEGFQRVGGAQRWTRVAPRGEPVEFVVVAKVAPDEQPPGTLWVRGKRRGPLGGLSTLTRVGPPIFEEDSVRQRYRKRIERLDDSLELMINGADARIQVRLVAADRPLLTELTAVAQPPAYLQSGPREVSPASMRPLPEGSQLTFTATATKPITTSDATFQRIGPATPRTIDSGVDDNLRLTVQLASVADPGVVSIRVVDEHGLESLPVEVPIQVARDRSPEVTLMLDGVGGAVTRDAVISTRLKVDDDHDLRLVKLVARPKDPASDAANEQTLEPPRLLPGLVEAKVDLLSLRSLGAEGRIELQPGDRLVLQASVADRYDLGERPATESSRIELEVVSPAELLARLGDAQLDLRQVLESLRSDVERLEYELDLAQRRGDDPEQLQRWAAERRLDANKIASGLGPAIERAEGIREQVVNNRLDQPALIDRLGRRVIAPLRRAAENDLSRLAADLTGPEVDNHLADALRRAASTKRALDESIDSLQTQQTYNEVIALLRGLIRDQRRVNQQTTRQQGDRARSLFD